MAKNKPAFNADDLIQRTEPETPSTPEAPPAPPTQAPQIESKQPQLTDKPIDKEPSKVPGIKRYNMAFDSDIYDYLEARKWTDRSTIKDLVNKIIREEMERHPVK